MTSLGFDEHADGLADAVTVLRASAMRSGLTAGVPTCPGWTVEDLVVHQGTVHRWATGMIRGESIDTEELERTAPSEPDLLGWLDDGALALLKTLDDAPDDLETIFFLSDAPPPKFAWARRQCHETSIHAADALSAALGRPPVASETWLKAPLAADGIDELLTGFLPRRKTRFRLPEPRLVHVEATEGPSWSISFSPEGAITTRDPEATGNPTTVLRGTAVQLYLGLWNRGAEIVEEGVGFLDEWRRGMTVNWR